MSPKLALVLAPVLLVVSNIFMTYAWYGHLKDFKAKPLWIAIAASWAVAFLEYCVQVPANRIGYQQAGLSLAQLKVMQEVVTMCVFGVFAVAYMGEKPTMNFLYASLCLVAAAWFMFKDFRPAA
ncbi:MAG: DMT family protein [Planctomycetota bacterium]